MIQAALRLLQEGAFGAAAEVLAPLVETAPQVKPAYGLALIGSGDWLAASRLYESLCADHPQQADYWLNLGIARQNLSQADSAVEAFRKVLEIQPGHAAAHGNLSNLYYQQKDFVAAERHARAAWDGMAQARMPTADIRNSLALALDAQRHFAGAVALWDGILAEQPRHVQALANKAASLQSQMRIDEACDLYEQARAFADSPALQRDQGYAELQRGNYRKGWALHEARLALPGALVPPPLPLWQGEDIAAKHILIISEQGYGDVIQFMRFIPRLVSRAGRVTLAVKPPLLALATAQGWCDVVDMDQALAVQADYYLPIISLPLRLGLLVPADWPAVPYLKLPDKTVDLPGTAARRIGLVWQGSATHLRDHERSLPLEKLAPLWQLPDTGFYAVFRNDGLQQIDRQPVQRIDGLTGDFTATAAVLAQLDCLVTVDTALAHLAGALGLPVILLLDYAPDWRRGCKPEQDGDRWYDYEGFRVLRQQTPGDWDGVIDELEKLLSSSSSRC